MGWTFLCFEAGIAAVFTILLFRRYGAFTKRPIAVVVATLLGWYLAFSVVFLIPNDISSTRWEICIDQANSNSTSAATSSPPVPKHCGPQPISYVDYNNRLLFWRILYWSIYVATCSLNNNRLVFPILQPYSMAGDFDFKGKMKRVGRVNLIYWGSMFIVAVILLLYLMVYKGIDFATLLAVCMALGNAWGLLTLVILLGVGLVEIPRGLWLGANLEVQLNHYRFKVSSLNKKRADAREALLKVLKQIKKYDDVIRQSNPMRKFLDIIIEKCVSYNLEWSSLVPEGMSEVSEDDLVALHERLMMAEHNVTVTQSQFDNYIVKAVELEDVLVARRHRAMRSSHQVQWTLPRQTIFSETRFEPLYTHALYFWKVYAEVIVRRVAAVLCAILSVATIWSECVFAIKRPVLSLWAIFINIPSLNDFVLHLFVFLPIVYMSVCAFSSMLGLEMWSFYRLIPTGKTDSYSLLFSAGYLLRLFGPLSYNFLFMVQYDTTRTTFIRLMGLMNQVPLFGNDYFILFFPISVVVVCALVATDFHKTVLGMFTAQFEYDEDFEHSDIADGRQVIDAEKRRRAQARGHSRSTSLEIDATVEDLEMRTVRQSGSASRNIPTKSGNTALPKPGHRRFNSADARLDDSIEDDLRSDLPSASLSGNNVSSSLSAETNSIWSRLKNIVSNTATTTTTTTTHNSSNGANSGDRPSSDVDVSSSPSTQSRPMPSFSKGSTSTSSASTSKQSSDIWKLSRK